MPPEDRRAQLSAAFDKTVEEEKVESAAAAEPAAAEPVVEAPATPVTTPEKDVYTVEAEAAAAKPAEGTPEVTPETPKPPEEDPVPISWKAEEKAHWSKVPPEVRKTIIRRELETQRALSTSAQARKFAEEFGRTVSPYAHLIRAQNSTPIQAVDNLMRTAAGLTVGDAQQKARIVAEIVANYGVDIKALDEALSSAPPPPNAGAAAIPPQFAQMLQPVYQFMERIENSRKTAEQQMEEKAAADIAAFGADKPFFNEVREEMADLIEIAARNGRTLTLEQAYKKAIAGEDKYSAALEQRNKANEVSQAAATLARARRAASSVAGAPSTGTGVKTPTTRREALSQAWDEKAS